MNTSSPVLSQETSRLSLSRRARRVESLEHLELYHKKNGDILHGGSRITTPSDDGERPELYATGMFIRIPEEDEYTYTLLLKARDFNGDPLIEHTVFTPKSPWVYGAWVLARTPIDPPN